MLVLGIDPSLTATGLAMINPQTRRARVAEVKTTPTTSDLEARSDRQRGIALAVDAFVGSSWPHLVIIEAPSFGSRAKSAAQHERSGLFWSLVRLSLKYEATIVEVSPRARAKYATGNGNAVKASVVEATLETYRSLLDERELTDNEADALALAAMGARSLGYPVERSITPAQLDAMKRVDWLNMKGNS